MGDAQFESGKESMTKCLITNEESCDDLGDHKMEQCCHRSQLQQNMTGEKKTNWSVKNIG